MSGPVFDNLTQTQSISDGPIASNGSWGPGGVGHTRNLTSTLSVLLGTLQITGGQWALNAILALSLTTQLIYSYGSGFNFNPIHSVTITYPSGSTTASALRITLSDGTNQAGPLAASSTTAISSTWNIAAFTAANPSLNLSSITSLTISISGLGISLLGTTVIANGIFSNLLPCVARDTLILMDDGKETPISNLKVGDCISSGVNEPKSYVISKVVEKKMPGNFKPSIMKFENNSLGEYKPHTDLIISSGHKIIHNDMIKRARFYSKNPGVKFWRKNTPVEQLLPVNEDGSYSLFNLQFDSEGSFVANGVVIESIPPGSLFAL